MAEMTDKEKYERKSVMLKRALASADRLDAADKEKDVAAKTEPKEKDTEKSAARQESTRPEALPIGS